MIKWVEINLVSINWMNVVIRIIVTSKINFLVYFVDLEGILKLLSWFLCVMCPVTKYHIDNIHNNHQRLYSHTDMIIK